MSQNLNNPKPASDLQPSDDGLSSSALFAADIDDKTYVIRNKSDQRGIHHGDIKPFLKPRDPAAARMNWRRYRR